MGPGGREIREDGGAHPWAARGTRPDPDRLPEPSPLCTLTPGKGKGTLKSP